jgi:predicted nucleotidyltransferase
MELETEALPKILQKKGLKEKLAEICTKNDVVFLAIFGSVVRGEHKKNK